MKELQKILLFFSPTALKLLGEKTGKQIEPKAFKAIFRYEQKPNDYQLILARKQMNEYL